MSKESLSGDNASEIGEESGFRDSKVIRARSREKEKVDGRAERLKKKTGNTGIQFLRTGGATRSLKAKRVESLEQTIRQLARSLSKELDLGSKETQESFKIRLKDFQSDLSLVQDEPEEFFNSSIGKYLAAIKDILEKNETENEADLSDLKDVVGEAMNHSTKILVDYVDFAE